METIQDTRPETPWQLAAELELSEARALSSLINAPDDAEKRALGLHSTNIGSAVAVMAQSIPSSLNLNRVVGLGVREPVTDAALDEVDQFYARIAQPYAIELCPSVLTDQLKTNLRARNIRRMGSKTAMFIHRMHNVPTVDCNLRVERVDGRHAEQLAAICCDAFNMPPETGRILRAVHRQPGWVQWMGFDGDTPAGAALSFHGGTVAWSGWAATVPAFRGRRFHAAYLAAAVRYAAASGCTTFTAETATGTETQRDPAYRNLLKLGFELAYERASYMGRPAAL